MKKINSFLYVISVIFCVTICVSSCDTIANIGSDEDNFCERFKLGSVSAKSNFKNLDGYALFNRWRKDTIDLIAGDIWSKNCGYHQVFRISNIPLEINDTIKLKFSEDGLTNDFPTASFTIYDYRTPQKSFDLITGDGIDNWVYITSINPDTSIIKGTFQVFLKDSIASISNIDPDVDGFPDTLIYRQGHFVSEFWE